MTRGLSPIIGLLAALLPVVLPALAHAQTNLDQGKSASQIFTAICAECHKASPRALAHGRDSAALTDYLREHYTTSRDQAAALAAYVLGGRGGEPIGGTQKKPPPDRASAEEPKPGKPKPGKPEEGASTKPKRPAEADAKPKDDPGEIPGVINPIIRPEGGKPPSAATRNRRQEPKPPAVPTDADAVGRTPAAPPAPPTAAVVPNPAPAATQAPPPAREAPPASAVAPADGGDSAPVPRDNIAD